MDNQKYVDEISGKKGEVDLLNAPCYFCGYNSYNYWAEGSHHRGCPWRHIGGINRREENLAWALNRYIEQQIRQAQLDVLISLKKDTEVLDDTVAVNWKWIVDKINQLKEAGK